jgi:hypothetical protein
MNLRFAVEASGQHIEYIPVLTDARPARSEQRDDRQSGSGRTTTDLPSAIRSSGIARGDLMASGLVVAFEPTS